MKTRRELPVEIEIVAFFEGGLSMGEEGEKERDGETGENKVRIESEREREKSSAVVFYFSGKRREWEKSEKRREWVYYSETQC